LTRHSRTRLVSAVALFVALAVVFNLTVYFPAPYAPFLSYEVWEIPIVLALLMFGLRIGVTVAILNTLTLELLNPGSLPSGPVYNLIAILSMFLGITLGYRFSSRLKLGRVALVISATALGIFLRVVVMTVVNAAVLPLPYPLGFSIPYGLLPSFLYLIAIFNATITLYTVPLAYSVYRGIMTRYHVFGVNRDIPGMGESP
jgi:riboflavin transporter FmnP